MLCSPSVGGGGGGGRGSDRKKKSRLYIGSSQKIKPFLICIKSITLKEKME